MFNAQWRKIRPNDDISISVDLLLQVGGLALHTPWEQ